MNKSSKKYNSMLNEKRIKLHVFEPELVKLGYSSKMTGANLLRWIKRNNFPKGFQVLCHNCNFVKGQSKDNKCPHERK